MKKQSILLCYLLVAFMALSAQPVVNGIMQGSPRTFMVNPATQTATSWARPYYGSCSSTNTSTPMNDIGGTGSGPGPFATTPGVTTYSSSPSHQLKIRTAAQIASNTNPTDPNAIMYPGSTHLPIFPPAFDRDVRPTAFEDTVMQMGHTSGTAKAQRMEYKFIPDTMNPVLLVQYECILENGNHDYNQNPSVQILVSGVNDFTPLNLGYYPNDYCGETGPCNGNANLGTASPNDKWPYSRYYFIQDRGSGYSFAPLGPYLTPCRWYADNGFTIYTNGGYSDFTSTQYVTVAFNLMEQARNHTPVRLTILMLGCHQSAHCSYLYYTAKMVPGKIDAIACGDVVDFQIPYGFDANSYRWQRGLNADMLEEFTPSNQYRFSIPTDEVMPYYRCTMESQTGVPFTYEAHVSIYSMIANFDYKEIGGNCEHKVCLSDTSSRIYAITPGFLQTPPDTQRLEVRKVEWYQVSPTGAETLVARDTSDVVLTYPADVDSAQVKLVIFREGTDCTDTIVKWMRFDPKFVEAPSSRDTIQICPQYYVDGKYRHNTPGAENEYYDFEYDGQVIDVVYPDSAWNKCDSTVHTLLQIQKPEVTILSDIDYCENFETILYTDKEGEGYTYEWSNGETTPQITVERAGSYSVLVTDESQCEASDNYIIPTCKPYMNLPTAITPSTDANAAGKLNDCFTVPQYKLIKYIEFTVFTRTGELIYTYKGDPKDFRWCGTKGETSKRVEYNRVYPYILKYTDLDNVTKIIKSTITVL